MRNHLIFGALTAFVFSVSSVALADNTTAVSADVSTSSNAKWHFGGELGLGIPSGVTLGLVVEPKHFDWLQVEAGAGYNYLAFGPQASLRLDPLALVDSPVGIFGDLQAGLFPVGQVPTQPDWPGVGYDYVSFMGGLRFGKATGFHWSLFGGEDYIHLTTNNFQAVVKSSGTANLMIGNPVISGWTPCLRTAFTLVF
jgi:hypothetical protein